MDFGRLEFFKAAPLSFLKICTLIAFEFMRDDGDIDQGFLNVFLFIKASQAFINSRRCSSKSVR